MYVMFLRGGVLQEGRLLHADASTWNRASVPMVATGMPLQSRRRLANAIFSMRVLTIVPSSKPRIDPKHGPK